MTINATSAGGGGVDFSSIAADGSPDSTDYLLMQDIATGDTRKVTIADAQGVGAGEANTASSSGTGTSVYYQKTGTDIELNAIKSENNRLAVALDGTSHDIELTVTEGNIVHQNLSGAGTNTHAQIDTAVSNSVSHIAGDGSGHADVATNTAHISADGSSHSFIDQDVTSGSTPTLTGTNFTGIPETGVDIQKIGSPTYTTLDDFVTLTGSTGHVSGGAITDGGGGNINVAAGQGFIRAADAHTSALKAFDWSVSNGNAVASGAVRYVGVEYNAGSPQVVLKTTDSWDSHTDFRLGVAANEGGTLHILNDPERVTDVAIHAIQRNLDAKGIERADVLGGLILGETGTRNVSVSEGSVYSGLNKYSLTALDTSVTGSFASYYDTTQQAASATQWDNDNYNNGGSLTALTTNRYANLWFYVEADDAVVMVYGTAQYTSTAGAEAEAPPSTLPIRLTKQGLLIGRIIFQKGASSAVQIDSTFTTTFTASQAADHGNLAGIGDDDHTQYLLADGTRAMSGNLDMGANNVTNVGTGHDTFSDFVSDEHVAHSGVTLTAGTGLTGGGTIASNRTFNVDVGIGDDKILEVDDAGAADDEYARFTANGIEGRSKAETFTDLGAETALTDSDTSLATSGGVFDHVAGITANTQTGTSYTLVLTDRGKLVTLNNASAITLTIPANASVAFPTGTQIELAQLGAGQVTVAITSDTMNSSGSKTKLTGQYSTAVLTKLASTTWILAGDIAT